jgi:hypothetical protein
MPLPHAPAASQITPPCLHRQHLPVEWNPTSQKASPDVVSPLKTLGPSPTDHVRSRLSPQLLPRCHRLRSPTQYSEAPPLHKSTTTPWPYTLEQRDLQYSAVHWDCRHRCRQVATVSFPVAPLLWGVALSYGSQPSILYGIAYFDSC